MKLFVLVTKVLPMLLALCHFVNTILSYCYIEIMFLNYFASISILCVAYLYFASYVIRGAGLDGVPTSALGEVVEGAERDRG